MNIGIVGCGLIGFKRMQALPEPHRVVFAADLDASRAAKLATDTGAQVLPWQELVSHPRVEAVMVATTHDALAPATLAAINSGKHVLVEKPAARNARELKPVIEEARKQKVVVKVGFNHRFHPAFQKAREIVDSGVLGPLMFIRARYGHGGRPGYDREWRANPEISGGGELLDQGMHLIDLSQWFLGKLEAAAGFAHTYFWDMPVDDNAFMFLKSPDDQVAWLHVSWTEWKNLFSFEIYGRDGKLHIEGLGGSYGVERISFYKMLPAMGPPDTIIYEFPGKDRSWELEFADFARAVETGAEPCGNLEDAANALEIVDTIYKGVR